MKNYIDRKLESLKNETDLKKVEEFERFVEPKFLGLGDDDFIRKFWIKLQVIKDKIPKNEVPGIQKKHRASTDNKKIRRLCLRNHQSPGDTIMMTAMIRDLHLIYPGKFKTTVSTPFPELWEFNEYIDNSFGKNDEGVEVYDVGYDEIINNSNEGAYHFIHGFHISLGGKLKLHIPVTKFWGHVPISDKEKSWISMINEHYTKEDTPYWIIFSGGKKDYTIKHWIPEYAQEVVNHFKDKIQFVQCGDIGDNHHHPKLDGTIDLRGKTDIRQFIRLMYHAQGVVCPITFAMHLAAAVEVRNDRPMRRACVTIGGGREPHNFVDYTNHAFLHTNGMLSCCDNGGCWKSRTVALGDGDKKDEELCINTVDFEGRKVQKCMHMITASDVISKIGGYMNHEKMEFVEKTIEG